MINVVKYYTVDEFFELSDDKKRYVFSSGNLQGTQMDEKKIENDEKIGWYEISSSVKMNNKGTFYRKSTLNSWIVYRKDKKTVSVKNGNRLPSFLRDNFAYPYVVGHIINSISKTFVKMTLEGKINTIRDLAKFQKRMIFSGIKIKEENVLYYSTRNLIGQAKVLQDPNTLHDEQKLRDIPWGLINARPFLIKDINNYEHEWKEWENRKSNAISEIC